MIMKSSDDEGVILVIAIISLLQERHFLTVTNYIFTIIFATEMILKVRKKKLLMEWL